MLDVSHDLSRLEFLLNHSEAKNPGTLGSSLETGDVVSLLARITLDLQRSVAELQATVADRNPSRPTPPAQHATTSSSSSTRPVERQDCNFSESEPILWKSIHDLQLHQRHMDDALSVLNEEHDAIRDFLSEAGLTQEGLEERIRSRRNLRLLTEVFQVPELSLNVALAAGFSSTRQLMGVSRDFCAGLDDILLELSPRLLPKIYVCGGRRDGSCMASSERFDPSDGRWEKLPSMPTARYGCAAGALNGCLYVVGGHGGGPLLSVAERYDPAKGKWERLPDMPTVRSSCCVAPLGGYLYIIGGFDGRGPISTMERYDPRTWRWERLAPMPTARYDCCCASAAALGPGGLGGASGSSSVGGVGSGVGGGGGGPGSGGGGLAMVGGTGSVGLVGGQLQQQHLYVFAGHNGSQPVATAERYNPVTGAWTALSRVPTPRHGCSAVAAGGRIYVLGGFDGRRALATAERFDVSTGRWEILTDMPRSRYEFAAARVMGRIYIFGGHDGHQALGEAWHFNMQLEMWVPLQPMLAPRSGCACAAVIP